MSTTNLTLSVPELIKPESCEYEIENIEREKEKYSLEENEVDLLERIQSYTELEIWSLEELERSQRRCEEMEERILQMGAKIHKFRQKKLSLKEMLDRSRRKCEELQRRNVEATQANDELRVKKMESDNAAQLYRDRLHDLELRVLKGEAAHTKALNVIHANFVGAMGKSATAAIDFVENGKVKAEVGDGDAMPPDVCVISDDSGGSGGIQLSKRGSSMVVFSHSVFISCLQIVGFLQG